MAFLNKIKDDPILPEPRYIRIPPVFIPDQQNYVVSVENPRKIGDKNAYVSYTVKCTRKAENATTHVERRYSDFEWLWEHLKLAHPTCVVPQIPEKTMSGNFDEGLMAFRAREMTRFLQRVLAHPLMSTDEAVQVFVTASESEFAARRSEKGVFQKDNFITQLKRAATSVLNVQEDPDEWFKDKADDILHREVLLTQMLTTVQRTILSYQGLIKVYNAQAATLREFIKGVDEGHLKSTLENEVKALDDAREIMEDMAFHLSVTVSGNILDYIHELQSIHSLIERRAPYLREYATASKDSSKGQEAQSQFDQFSNAARADIQQVCDLRRADMGRFFNAVNQFSKEFSTLMANRWKDVLDKQQPGTAGATPAESQPDVGGAFN